MELSLVKIKKQVVYSMLSHCANSINAGIPLADALASYQQEQSNAAIKSWVNQLYRNVRSGQPLSHTLEKQSNVLSPVAINLIRAGEQSACLAQALQQLEQQYVFQCKHREKIVKACSYPLLILLMIISMVTALVLFVLPNLVEIYEQAHVILPTSTRLLLASIGLIQQLGLPCVGLVGLSFYGLWQNLQQNQARLTWHQRLLQLPYLGRVLVQYQLSLWAANLSALLQAKQPLCQALKLINPSLNNLYLRERITLATQQLEQGNDFAAALPDTPSFQNLKTLWHLGETTQQIPESLAKYAHQQQTKLERQLNQISTYLEPGLMLLMSVLVGFVLIALYSPLFQMGSVL